MINFKSKKTWFGIIIAIILIGSIISSMRSCSEERREKSFVSVPNVMGVEHGAAKAILEKAGFKVTEVEADAETILSAGYSGYNRTVKMGQVFKVNDETDPTYKDYKGNPISKDGNVTIYYAENDYIYEDSDTDEYEDDSLYEDEKSSESKDSSPEKTNIDWKGFLKEYETWVDNYIKIMEKYAKNPTDFSIISDYMKATEELAKWADKLDDMEDDLLDDGEALAEYLATLSRISVKLSQIDY